MVVLEDEVVSTLAWLLVVELLVEFVVLMVVVWVTDVVVAMVVCVELVVTDCPETGTEPLPARVRSASIAKVNQGSEPAPELALFACTDDWAPSTSVRNGCGHMTFSASGTSVYQKRLLLLLA